MYALKILCEASKVPFEISRQMFKPHIAKYAFYEVLKFDESWHLKS